MRVESSAMATLLRLSFGTSSLPASWVALVRIWPRLELRRWPAIRSRSASSVRFRLGVERSTLVGQNLGGPDSRLAPLGVLTGAYNMVFLAAIGVVFDQTRS